MKIFLSLRDCYGLDRPNRTYQAVISRITTWSDGQTLTASALNGEFNNILNDYNSNITNANISAAAAIAYSKLSLTGSILNTDLAGSIASSKISGTAVTLAGVESLSNKTFSDTLNLTTGAISQIGSAAHITLTPGASKLVKVTVLENTHAVNTYRNNAIILTGFEFVNLAAGATTVAKSVSFGITFTTAPMIVCQIQGIHSTSPTDQTTYVAGDVSNTCTGGACTDILTTGFTYTFQSNSSGVNMATGNFGFMWIAIGTL